MYSSYSYNTSYSSCRVLYIIITYSRKKYCSKLLARTILIINITLVIFFILRSPSIKI